MLIHPVQQLKDLLTLVKNFALDSFATDLVARQYFFPYRQEGLSDSQYNRAGSKYE